MNSNRKQTPGGHKEERASFPTQSQYKTSQEYIPLVLILERKEKNGERGRATGERWEALAGGGWFCSRRKERGEGIFMVPTQGSKIPLDSN